MTNRASVDDLRGLQLKALIAILAVLAVLKAFYNPPPLNESTPDGGFYFQIARHVTNGDGLLTSVSAQSQGIKKLPFTSNGYPLWPLLLAVVGFPLGLDRAAVLLPEILYLISLLILYRFVNRIAETWGSPAMVSLWDRPAINLGHLFVLVLGLNSVYFQFTSLPFTEALAFTLLFGSLLALEKVSHGRPLLWGGVAGGLAGLSYLSRYQFLGALLMICLAILGVGIAYREYRSAAGVAFLCAFGPAAIWFAYVTKCYGHFEFAMLLDVYSPRQTPELEPYQFLVNTKPLALFLRDRLWGTAAIAFSPRNPFSYIHSFGPAAYLPVMGLLYLLLRPAAVRNSFRKWVTPQSLLVVATLCVTVACLLPVHAMHANRYGGWFFQFRHGLPFILAMVLSAGFLFTRPERLVRVSAILLIIWSVLSSGVKLKSVFDRLPQHTGPGSGTVELSRWIDRQPGFPVFISTQPYILAALSNGRFHAVSCAETAKQMKTYFELTSASHVIVRKAEENCPYFTSVQDLLVPVESFGSGNDEVAVWRTRISSAAEPAEHARRP